MSTPETVQTHLAGIVAERAPARLLLIGTSDKTCARLSASAPDNCTVIAVDEPDAGESIATVERFDLAIVTHTLERRPYAQGKKLLGRLRDVTARSVIVGINHSAEAEANWDISAFISMGFRRSHGERDLDAGWALYRYDIHDYKTTPSWLSSRYWANPERWDKERW